MTTIPMNQSMILSKDKHGKYKLKMKDTTNNWIIAVVLTFFLTTIYFLFGMCTYKWESVRLDLVHKFVSKFFDVASVTPATYISIVTSLVNTLVLTIITTLVSIVIGLLLGLFSARNLSNGKVCTLIRSIAGFVRAIPTIIWVLIFVSGFGLTATTAFVGMLFHSIAYFVKSFSESFEEVNEGTIEALKATGASWWQIVFNAVLPSSLTKLISWIAMRFEMNFAAAIIIGPAVGVPGTIGSLVNKSSREGNYATMGVCIFVIVITALIIEMIITQSKQRAIVSD